ncbi:MAG: hypothetical protein IPK63_19500 [Candidatus Competibacteraceae bacterium]|nr:hypothetical protein [Candidatus Competibacteraceae bacterium]
MSAALALLEDAAADPFGPVRAMNRLGAAGFTLSVRDGRLLATPFTKLSEQHRDFIRAHKTALAALLEDAETLHRALLAAGPAGLAWQAGTPADWPDTRLLVAGEVLYSGKRMASVNGRRFAAESAPPGQDIPPDMPSAPLAETTSAAATWADKGPDIASADPRRSAPPVCLPADYRPYRLLTRCDRPSPIYGPDGGDPVGCGNCGARWDMKEVAP